MRKSRPQRASPRTRLMSPSRTQSPMSPASSASRSPSPYRRQETPPIYLKPEQGCQGDAAEDSDSVIPSERLVGQGDNYVSPGTRYITEPLIKKLAKQENLGRITSLNLSLAKDGGKKFKYIENLEKCDKLEVLNLSHNLIEKIEKLDKLLKLCDLNMSYNKISKIEGIEHLHNLQKLNLSGNEIEHIPVWMGKKLRSLRILNLRKNKISSLHEVAKLKPLKDLTSLSLADNPVANLPHYRLYTIFHLRSLQDLEGHPVTNHDREEALERFNLEEIESLEKDLEKTMKEVEDLKNKQSDLLEQLQHQDEQNRLLKQKHLQQKQSCKDLENEIETKNELLKQKTVELTRACQKQYELEQELAFYKIDAKFEPLGYLYPTEDVELDDAPGESPYIGKARYKRNMYAVEGHIPSQAQKMQVGNMEQDQQQNVQQLKLNLLQSLDVQLEEKQRKIKGAQEKLVELQSEIANAEQYVLKATEELKQVQDAVAQKKMSEVEKDSCRQQLSSKILLLNQLREEALELEKQMERQRQEMARRERELEDLHSFIESLDPKDPRHAHMKAQKASKEQQLDTMNKHYKQLETRLDEMLSRIAKETEEIRDLEQQLTDGQIAANEALKKDLEAIITGLQEYLESVKGQAKQTSDECKELRKDKEALLQRVEELEKERNQMEIVAMDAENLRKDIADLEHAIQEQRELNKALQEAQGNLNAYGAELEAELEARDTEADRHKKELERLKQLSQLEHSALQAELGKERQALENALTKAQLLEEKEQENNKLISQLKQLQRDNNLLKQKLKDAQNQLNHAVDSLIHPEEVLSRVSELKRKLQTGAEIKCHNSKDILGKSLGDLQKQFGEMLAHLQQENEASQARESELQKQMVSQQAKLEEAQEKYRLACNRAAEAKIKSEKRQNETRVRQLENEIQHLSEKLKSMEEIQGLTDQQLQEAEEEKEKILAQLEELANRKKVEDARAQMQFLGIDKELKELKRAISASDKQATAELCAAKDQLRSLRGTVSRINQERTEELQEAEKFCTQATQASQDLARAEAEIELLQNLLKEKEEQYDMKKAVAETTASCSQKEEIDQLNQLLKCHKTEIDRLRSALDQARAGSRDEISSILNEIAVLRHAISHQNDTIASIMEPLKQRGHLFYMPSSSQASTPASQSTKDSGVGLQCPMSTPIRKELGENKPSKKERSASPAARECHLHTPVRSGLQESLFNERKQEEGELNIHDVSSFVPPPGSVIYSLLPDGAPAPLGTVVYCPPSPSIPANGGILAPTTVVHGPPPAGAHLVYYSPVPTNCSVPLVPVGVLHCNIPEHHNLENEILRLEDSIDKLKSEKQKSKSTRISHHEHNREMEELHQGIQDLLSEREELEHQVTELRKTAQKRNKRKDFLDGHMSGFLSELELEKSLQHHENIVDEIKCMEKTLLKRRAELREADRLLAEAEIELENTRGKTKDTIQKYNGAKQHLSRTEKEAEELERRAQEMAVRLVKADQQLRLLQADAKDLEQHKMEQEGVLKEINKVVSAKDSEFQSLSQKIEILTEILQKLQANIQVAEGNEDHHLHILKEAEHILQSKKSDLERLKDETAAQQQELQLLNQMLGQKEEELHLLQDSIIQKNSDLAEALRDGEAEVARKQRQIKEVKSFLEDLSVQKGELSAQLSEKRAQLSLIMQEIQKEEEKLQDVLQLIMKHKTELKHVLERLQLKNSELKDLELQHSQKVSELEKMQIAVLEEQLELENIQQASQQQRGEAECQRRLLEKTHQEVEQLNSQLRNLQKSIRALSNEKQQLEENCERLEEKLSQTKRSLASAEDRNKATLASKEKMNLDAQKLQFDIDQLEKHKVSLNGDIGDLQKHLHERKEELNILRTELSDSRHRLQLLEEDVKNAAKQKEELLQEQTALKSSIGVYTQECKKCQEAQRKMEIQLQKVCREIEGQELERAKQEKILQHLREDTRLEEKKLDECTAKLKDQKQQLRQELAEQQRQLEQVTAKVQEAEGRIRKLQEEESWQLTLEESIKKTRHQLSEKELKLQEKADEVLSLQRRLDLSKAEENVLHSKIQAERTKAEKQIASLKETIKTQRAQFETSLHEQKLENHLLQKEMASLEKVAQDNHQRAKQLMRDLCQIEEEYVQLKSQMKNQEDLEKRQKEVIGTVKMLKLEVKDKMRTGLKDLSQSPPGPDTHCEANGRLQSDMESLKENYPFTDSETRMRCFDEKLDLAKVHITDEQWRGKARREKLQHHEDRLKARLRQCMSKQAEVLIKGKQQTEGTLHSLKRQVDALDELVSSTSTDSLFLSLNSSGLTDSLQEELNLIRNQKSSDIRN
ncbi:centriolin isoform X2 [Sceloporus undulatus]|uniref:centriolin isoform X2 n=1 Tax=Sceloporus undulatus TaxID=8520 RepID=UPI001C4B798B|nr:centriolin isoform X2 [Sceloporus undulatus]